MIKGTFRSLNLLTGCERMNLRLCLWGNLPVRELRVSETSVTWPLRGTGLRKRCQLCWLHSSLGSTPDPLTHLRRLCLSNHLFCKMKWQQIKRSSQMVLMCFLHFGPLHAFSNSAPHFHVSVMWLLSSPRLPLCLLTNHIDGEKKIKQNQYCFYNESLRSQSCDYPFSQKNIHPHLLVVWWCELHKTLLINSHETVYCTTVVLST